MPAPHNQGKTWTDEDKSTLVSLYRSGLSKETIGNYLGRSSFAIECKLRELGYDPDNRPSKRYKEDKDMASTEFYMNLNPCQEIEFPGQPTEPTAGQLMLQEALFDMKLGEQFVIRGIKSKREYVVTGCEPFLGKGKVTLHDPSRGTTHVEDLPDVVALFELVAAEIAEYMVSVDGMQAPRKVHDSYDAACDEADRLARKHIGNRVRVLRLEHVIMAKQHVEVQECQ